jgi:hypothetical protein
MDMKTDLENGSVGTCRNEQHQRIDILDRPRDPDCRRPEVDAS